MKHIFNQYLDLKQLIKQTQFEAIFVEIMVDSSDNKNIKLLTFYIPPNLKPSNRVANFCSILATN